MKVIMVYENEWDTIHNTLVNHGYTLTIKLTWKRLYTHKDGSRLLVKEM